MDNAMEKGKHTLVDMGYADFKEVRDATDKITAVVSRKNVEIAHCMRVLVRIPPAKKARVLSLFPHITEGETYSWCTHYYAYKGRPPKSKFGGAA